MKRGRDGVYTAVKSKQNKQKGRTRDENRLAIFFARKKRREKDREVREDKERD